MCSKRRQSVRMYSEHLPIDASDAPSSGHTGSLTDSNGCWTGRAGTLSPADRRWTVSQRRCLPNPLCCAQLSWT